MLVFNGEQRPFKCHIGAVQMWQELELVMLLATQANCAGGVLAFRELPWAPCTCLCKEILALSTMRLGRLDLPPFSLPCLHRDRAVEICFTFPLFFAFLMLRIEIHCLRLVSYSLE